MMQFHSRILRFEQTKDANALVLDANFTSILPILFLAFAGCVYALQRASAYHFSNSQTLSYSLLMMGLFLLAAVLYLGMRFLFYPHSLLLEDGTITLRYRHKTRTLDLKRPIVFTLDKGTWMSYRWLPHRTLHVTDQNGNNFAISLGFEFAHEYETLLIWLKRYFREIEGVKSNDI
jgi:hypothetical protein